jgi:fructose-bisphosphate aldolase class II
MIIPTSQIYEHCYGKYGIAAINVWSLEQIHGLFSAAQKTDELKQLYHEQG